MTTRALTDLLAKKSRIKKSTAAEQVSRMVYEILRNLRHGEPATLPGLGSFEPGPTPKFRFEDTTQAVMRGEDRTREPEPPVPRPEAVSTEYRPETPAGQCEPVVRQMNKRGDHAGERTEQ